MATYLVALKASGVRNRPTDRCKPSGGPERTSSESTAVDWLVPDEVSERMSEVYAVRLLDALDGNAPHVQSHDGKHLLRNPA